MESQGNKNNITSIEELEIRRKEIVKKSIKIIVVFIFILIILFLFLMLVGVSIMAIPQLIFGLLFIGVFTVCILTYNESNNISNGYKHLIVLEVFRKVFDNVTYAPQKELDLDIIENTNVMKSPARYSSNDYMSATYIDIDFETADIHLESRSTDSGGNTEYNTFFKGQWYIFNFKTKAFKSNIQVVENNFSYSKRGDGLIKISRR